MSIRVLGLVVTLGTCLALQLPPALTERVDRRGAISQAFGRSLMLGAVASPVAAAFAYDTLPTTEPDFEKIEKLRKETEEKNGVLAGQIRKILKKIQGAA